MVVYIESNFILEIVLKQKYAIPAETILQLAENGKIELVFPSFALGEAFARITKRERVLVKIKKEWAEVIENLTIQVTDITKREGDRLWTIVDRLIEAGTSIETNKTCFKGALEYQKRGVLKPQDSIIYSAVLTHIKGRSRAKPKCFINSNYKDFKRPDIRDELNSYNCQYEQNFAQGLNYIQPFTR